MKRLRDEYKILDDWTQQDVYRVISVRYELELRSVDDIGLENYSDWDVHAESLAAVMELGRAGRVVENGTVREYNTMHAAHISRLLLQLWTRTNTLNTSCRACHERTPCGKSGVEKR